MWTQPYSHTKNDDTRERLSCSHYYALLCRPASCTSVCIYPVNNLLSSLYLKKKKKLKNIQTHNRTEGIYRLATMQLKHIQQHFQTSNFGGMEEKLLDI